jgi:hypothetical protein
MTDNKANDPRSTALPPENPRPPLPPFDLVMAA